MARELDTDGPLDVAFEPWPRDVLDRGAFERFVQVARRAPQRMAVTAGERRCTYDQLERLARQLATVLSAGDGPVAVWLRPGPELAAAFLACLASGRPCVPLDPDFPAQRNAELLGHAGATALVADSSTLAPPSLASSVQRVDVQQAAAQAPLVDSPATADSIAYILYTSGTTGRPKGVYQNQRGLLHDVMQYTHSIHLHAGDELSGLYSPSVNGAIRDIYAALFNGAGLHFLDVRVLGLNALAAAVHHARITVLHIIPPLLRAFLRAGPDGELLRDVRLIYLAGDRLFRQDIECLFRVFHHGPLLYVGIGSTENATLFRQWFVRPDTPIDGPLVPVGYALPERDCRVLGPDGQVLPPGEVGELECASPFLALGYWRDEQASAAAFRPDAGRPGWRFFRTGDLGCLRPDGLLEFVGRSDGQVKIRGHRVELAQVEAALRGLDGVTDAAVLTQEADGEIRLLAWVESLLPATVLAEALRCRLPASHQPAHLVCLPALPRLPNYKCDRQALRRLAPELNEPGARGTGGQAAGQSDAVTAAWCTALRLKSAPVATARFEDCGGDSLALLSLRAGLQQRGLELPLALCTPELTLARLQDHVARVGGVGQETVLFAVAGLTGRVPGLDELAELLRPSIRLCPLVLPGRHEDSSQTLTLPDMGALIAAAVVAGGPQQPVHLLGLSFGCKVVIEAAARLRERGVALGRVILVDNAPTLHLPRPLMARWRDAAHHCRQGKSVGERWQRLRSLVALSLLRRMLHRMSPRVLDLMLETLRRPLPRVAARLQEAALLQRRLDSRAGWQPPRLPHLVVLRAREGVGRFRDLPADLGWGPWADHVEVHDFDGGHPGQDFLAGELASAVQRVFASR